MKLLLPVCANGGGSAETQAVAFEYAGVRSDGGHLRRRAEGIVALSLSCTFWHREVRHIMTSHIRNVLKWRPDR